MEEQINEKNLVDDIREDSRILELAQDDEFAWALYQALCNNTWVDENGETCAVSMRFAGELVAEIRDLGEDYLDFYLSGGESRISDEVREEFQRLGWEEE